MNALHLITSRMWEALGELYEACAMAAEWIEEGEILPPIRARRGSVGRRRAAGPPGFRAPRYSKHRRAGRSAGQTG